MTEREASQIAVSSDDNRGEPEERLTAGATCEGCGEPGAGSLYKGKLYHMACRISAKMDAGEYSTEPKVAGKKRKKTSKRVKK